jgi:hypothetical protein
MTGMILVHPVYGGPAGSSSDDREDSCVSLGKIGTLVGIPDSASSPKEKHGSTKEPRQRFLNPYVSK